MSARVVNRAWSWRSFVWAGVVLSIVAWAWVWFRVGGGSVMMLLFAIAAVVLAYRGMAGVRVAMAGVMVAGFTMFLASVYLAYILLLQGSQVVTAADVVSLSVFPLVAAVVLLLGAVSGFRHVTESTGSSVSSAT